MREREKKRKWKVPEKKPTNHWCELWTPSHTTKLHVYSNISETFLEQNEWNKWSECENSNKKKIAEQHTTNQNHLPICSKFWLKSNIIFPSKSITKQFFFFSSLLFFAFLSPYSIARQHFPSFLFIFIAIYLWILYAAMGNKEISKRMEKPFLFSNTREMQDATLHHIKSIFFFITISEYEYFGKRNRETEHSTCKTLN